LGDVLHEVTGVREKCADQQETEIAVPQGTKDVGCREIRHRVKEIVAETSDHYNLLVTLVWRNPLPYRANEAGLFSEEGGTTLSTSRDSVSDPDKELECLYAGCGQGSPKEGLRRTGQGDLEIIINNLTRASKRGKKDFFRMFNTTKSMLSSLAAPRMASALFPKATFLLILSGPGLLTTFSIKW
jgi:hypothetical protein